MKLSDFAKQIGIMRQCRVGRRDDPEVCVVSQNYGPQVGGQRTVTVNAVSDGSDWDAGKVMLHTDPPVYDGVEAMQAAADFAYRVREIMYTHSTDKTRNRNAMALREIREALDEWLPDRMERDRSDEC